MTLEKRVESVHAIVDWVKGNASGLDRNIAVGFGPHLICYGYDDMNAWQFIVDRYGEVELNPVGLYVTYDRKSGETGGGYRHSTYANFCKCEEAACNDLLLAWPRIKSRLIDEVDRMNKVDDFEV